MGDIQIGGGERVCVCVCVRVQDYISWLKRNFGRDFDVYFRNLCVNY